MPPSRPLSGRLGGNAYLLLTLTTLMWGGNAVASKAAVGEISPMLLVCARWFIVVLALGLTMRRHLAEALPLLVRRWRYVGWMAGLGFTAFNAIFYVAGHYTTAINIGIIQGAIPIVVLFGAYLAYGTRVGWLQLVGTFVTIAGVAVAASHGDLAVLLGLQFNWGDIAMAFASLLYAAYTVGLRSRPNVAGLTFFAALAIVAFLTTIPLLAVEVAQGAFQWPTGKGLMILLYVSIFPSFLSQIMFMRGVEIIGPGRAGLFVNLVPVFAALLSVMILGEPFQLFHFIALALVLGGIALANR